MLRTKLILSASTVFLTLISYCQISVQAPLPSGINLTSNQSHNQCVITSNSDKQLNVYLEVQIESERGFPVVRYNTQAFQIGPGATVVNSQTTQVALFNYLNRDYGKYEQTNGHLPSDDYSICLIVKCADETCKRDPLFYETSTDRYSSCINKSALVITPLLLSMPYDEAELIEKRPNFSWIPPMPIGSDPNLSYQFNLVELREKQSAEAGIRRNRSLFKVQGLSVLNLPFPAELQDLIVDKHYAWQVTAFLGKTSIQTSEVWEFTIIEEEEEVFPMPYVRLKQTDKQIYNAVNELKFIFNQEGSSTKLNYSIVSITGESIRADLKKLDLTFGENSYKLDIASLGLKHKEFYILRVNDDNGKSYSLKFRYYFKKELAR